MTPKQHLLARVTQVRKVLPHFASVKTLGLAKVVPKCFSIFFIQVLVFCAHFPDEPHLPGGFLAPSPVELPLDPEHPGPSDLVHVAHGDGGEGDVVDAALHVAEGDENGALVPLLQHLSRSERKNRRDKSLKTSMVLDLEHEESAKEPGGGDGRHPEGPLRRVAAAAAASAAGGGRGGQVLEAVKGGASEEAA